MLWNRYRTWLDLFIYMENTSDLTFMQAYTVFLSLLYKHRCAESISETLLLIEAVSCWPKPNIAQLICEVWTMRVRRKRTRCLKFVTLEEKTASFSKNSVMVLCTWARISSMLSPILGSSDEDSHPLRAALRMFWQDRVWRKRDS